ncbi:MAG TPA: tetratricopeptide repeat protein [Rhizomicrobium sp.]
MNNHARRATLAAFLFCAMTGGVLFLASPATAQMGGGYSSSPPPPAPSAPSKSGAKQGLSRDVAPKIVDAQKLIQGKDYQGAMAELRALQGTATKDYDVYIVNRLIASAAIGLNDLAAAATAEEAAADSPAMPDDDRKSVIHDALQLSAYVKQWPKTIAYGQELAQLNGLDAQTAGNLAIAYYSTNDFAHAQQYAQQSMAMAKAAGQPPDPNALQIVMSSQVKQNNQAGAEQTLEQIALQNNTPDAWAQLIGVTFGAKGMGNLQALYLYRLLQLTGAMKGDDYKVMGSDASDLGYPTEAMNALQQGVSSGKISGAEAGSTLSKARRDAAMDERSLPQIAAAAEKSRTGEQDVKLGEDYWGYGRYADAEAAARRGIGKGGLKAPWEGPMLLGATEVAQGKYADAIQTLSQVTGNEADTRVAHLWSLFAQAKQGPARAGAAPASQSPSQ